MKLMKKLAIVSILSAMSASASASVENQTIYVSATVPSLVTLQIGTLEDPNVAVGPSGSPIALTVPPDAKSMGVTVPTKINSNMKNQDVKIKLRALATLAALNNANNTENISLNVSYGGEELSVSDRTYTHDSLWAGGQPRSIDLAISASSRDTIYPAGNYTGMIQLQITQGS